MVSGISHPVVQEASCFFNLSCLGSLAGQSAFVMQAAWHQKGHVRLQPWSRAALVNWASMILAKPIQIPFLYVRF